MDSEEVDDAHKDLQSRLVGTGAKPFKVGIRKDMKLRQHKRTSDMKKGNSTASLPPINSESKLASSASAGSLHDNKRHTLKQKKTKTSSQVTKNRWLGREESGYGTFTASLNLDSRYLDEFNKGNFIYLKPKAGLGYTMYDLEVAEHYEIDRDNYFTMSQKGVTHFGQNELEFCPLDQWEREYSQFSQIRQILFFRRYRAWKSFSVWSRNIRQARILAASSSIKSMLFIINPFLSSSLQSVRKACFEISASQIVSFEKGRTYSIQDFRIAQAKSRDSIVEKLHCFSKGILQTVIKSCDAVVDNFLEVNNIAAEHKMTFMERAALRKECRRLSSFLRLVDFLVIDAILGLALNSMKSIYQSFKEAALQQQRVNEEIGPPCEPLFVVNIDLDDDEDQIITSPTVDELTTLIEDVIKEALLVVDTPERLIGHEALTTYTSACSYDEERASSGEDQNLAILLNDDSEFNQITNSIFSSLEEAFENVDESLDEFDTYHSTYNQNEDQMSKYFEIFQNSSAIDMNDAILQLDEQVSFFEEIPVSKRVGMMLLNCTKFRNKLLPSPFKCINYMKELIPSLIHQKCDAVIDELNQLNPIARSDPVTPGEFVLKISHMQNLSEILPKLKTRYQEILQLYNILDAREWDVTESLKEKRIIIKDGIVSLDESANKFENTIDGENVRFLRMIDEDIPLLRKEISCVREKLDHPSISDTSSDSNSVITYLKQQEVALKEFSERASDINSTLCILEQPSPEFESLGEANDDLRIKLSLWQGVKGWEKITEQYTKTRLIEIDTVEMQKSVSRYSKTAFQAESKLASNKVAKLLKEKVSDFKQVMPVVSDIRCNDLQNRHWKQIVDLFEYDIQNDEAMTLGGLIERSGMDHAASISTIAVAAQQEAVLEAMLLKVLKGWDETDLEVKTYKEQKEVFVLGSVEDIITNLDDSIVTISTILGSRYVGPIREEVEKCRKKLVHFQETLDEWMGVQKNWMYLESIFAAPDIQRQLPDSSATFMHVDSSWKAIMKRTHENPSALVAGTSPGLKETFQQHNAHLDRIQKSLEDYLETKRMSFPRFYFLSNDELLEILAQSKNPQAVQPHLRKCFENLITIDFGEATGSVDMLAMISYENERVPLGKNLKARGAVEDWLKNLENSMKQAIYKLMKAGLLDYDTKQRAEWVCDHPGQVVATVAQMTWARETELAIQHSASDNKTMEKWFQSVVYELDQLIGKIRGKLTSLERKVIVALITTDVHARDIVERLRDEKVDTSGNFIWQQQLRYYWDTGLDDVVMKHSDSIIRYGYEYMGATSRLVITPLTDRCWMTLTGAYGLKLGAAPAGPAGTGKTESSKDLAKAMAIQCVVFNCSDQIDYKMMGKLFRGLAQAGNWTCLDEFNRIDIEVLSVVAQQLLTLREGRLAARENINFMGVQIPLRDHHVIVTMNPGYAGRTELPDNLKICFRPVSMMVPDYALIAEIMLFAEGFSGAKSLSRKMCKLYILCSEQLSQQPHYDYGLRAVKSVLVMAGSLKRGNPNLSEDINLIRALRDSNIPKFLSDDLPLFHAIVSDLFPGIEIPPNDYGEIEESIIKSTKEMELQDVPLFRTKVVQLFDIFRVRFGTTLVGPAGSGKTTCYRLLQHAMTALREAGSQSDVFQTIKTQILNPKCISMGELYGEFNEMTQEWHDGLASTLMRQSVSDDSTDVNWTVFDGPIDALWIENMNTVLDDNMTLCLANGERIKLRNDMRMLFEVMDLEVASPATVSRIGVVFMTPSDLGWMPHVVTWLHNIISQNGMKLAVSEKLTKLTNTILEQGFRFLRKHCSEPVPTVNINIASSFCRLFSTLYQEIPNSDGAKAKMAEYVDLVFLFCFVWTFGGSIHSSCREAFDLHCRSIFDDDPEFNARLPPSNTMYDYYIDMDECNLLPWSTIVPKFKYCASIPYSQLMVPTPDNFRYSFILGKLIHNGIPSYTTGVTGSGKTVVIQNLLQGLAEEGEKKGSSFVSNTMNFSAQTSSLVTQRMVESNLEKKRKSLLGPPTGKKMIVFVDDVNMPATEEYGAQPPIELLRQFLDFKGFYDREKLFWKNITETQLMVSAAPAGGGRSHCTPRFVRHFNVICMEAAAENTLREIFEVILGSFLSAFSPAIKSLKNGVVSSIIEIYLKISQELLPTPAKFHYTFNLRDISKVFQGVLMVIPQKCLDANTLHKLWIHEASRVFGDRLNTVEDRDWFENLACDLLRKNFNVNWSTDQLFKSTCPLIFGDFMKPGTPQKDYESVSDIGKVIKVLEDYMAEYNLNSSSQLNLVFFQDAIKHLCRLARIFRQPRGNAMLIGVGGSGKQSLTRLAASMQECELFRIEITRGYGLVEFREDLKTVMRNAGVEGKSTVFLFTDNQIVEESFLEDINNVLNSGEVPNLFPSDEMEKVLGDMRPVVKELGLPESRDVCLSAFINRVKDNLHIVLCMSPVGSALRVRCRAFPSLINCTTIDWYMNWPREALLSVAERLLADVEMPSEEVRKNLVEMCTLVHTSSKTISVEFLSKFQRHVYTTPKSYLDLIKLYLTMLREKRTEILNIKNQLSLGVQKLEETNLLVDNLKADLIKLQPVLKEKAIEAEKLLKQVAIDQAAAAVVRDRVSKDEAEVGKQADEVRSIQKDAQKDLDVAMPVLNNSIKALDSLSKADITEVKSFKTPPEAVKTVMEAVCILLNSKTDWDSAKKLLSDLNFIERLKTYDKDNISATVLKKLNKYILDPGMAVDVVKKVSKAATSLCMWVHAMDMYSKVAKDVGPKKAKLEIMNRKLESANKMLSEKQAELDEVNSKVLRLENDCQNTISEKTRLSDEARQTEERLGRAAKLISGLSSEGVRWKQNVTDLSERIKCLVGDVFLAAASISYYGAFTGQFRQRLVDEWREGIHNLNVPFSASYTLVNTLGSPVQARQWQLSGLPSDAVSTDNAVLVTRAERWPLMIDPQGQAKRWIKTENKLTLDTTRMTDINMLRSLESCIRVGYTLLIEDIEETIEPSLEPVLQRAVFKQGGRTLLHLGDSDIDYDENFKLYMTTKLSNPHYLPEVCIKVTVINFTVTMDGLEDQLLGEVLKREQKEMEERKTRLVIGMANDKKQLSDIQARILKMLSESTGNVLDDVDLIDTLASSKSTATIINERVLEAEKTEMEINETRENYRSVATRGSILYFVIADLASIDPMYQYSLAFYQKLFCQCIVMTPKSSDFEIRIRNLIDYQTHTIFTNICRGLFEVHKMLFSTLICCKIMINAGEISSMEWNYLLRGCGPVENSMAKPGTLTQEQWNFLLALEENISVFDQESNTTINPFKGICISIEKNWNEWAVWLESPLKPEELPNGFSSILSPFHVVLLAKALAEDKVQSAIIVVVQRFLGVKFVQSPATSMEDIFNDTDMKTPCIFVLSAGADPTGMLLRFAKERQYSDRLHVISLGQGQGPHAKALIEKSLIAGDWVLLQNCHLAKSWMPELEKLVDSFSEPPDTGVYSNDFRLFLTSFPALYFPVTVLQNGVKLTNEPPKGIRANLVRSFGTMVNEELFTKLDGYGKFSNGVEKATVWKKLLVGLVFFHAVVQERRKFGPLGWNIKYEFNDADLETSLSCLQKFLCEQSIIPWDALTYVTGEINYGGRVTDDWDRRCLMSILGKYYTDKILCNDYIFSSSGSYYAPIVDKYEALTAYAKSLPSLDNPELFGMHGNANVTFEKNESQTLVASMLSIEPRDSGTGSGKTFDEIVLALAGSIEQNLPKPLKAEDAGPLTFTTRIVLGIEVMDSLATVLSQEMIKFNRLLERMTSSLCSLRKAINGLIVMSYDLDTMYSAFINNQVPPVWESVGFASLKGLGSWVKDLESRVTFFRKWLLDGPPVEYSLSAFFFPQGFMTGTLQNYARKYQKAIDGLSFTFTVLDPEAGEIRVAPKDGVYVFGLWLEGARWSMQDKCLVDANPGEMYSHMPTIHFLPSTNVIRDRSDYACPVYKTSARRGTLSTTGISTNFVVAVYLKSQVDPQFWVLNGAAFLLNLDY